MKQKLLFSVVVVCILISSCTVVAILAAMLVNNVPLTILVLVMTVIMGIATEKIGGASAKYFIKQQETLGDVTGYIEEMINGQKVIKVFCHEEESKQRFDKENVNLCQDSTLANKYGNILMPTIMQLGNLQYILIALIGGFMALSGVGNISVGMIVAFLNLSKTFYNPVSQIVQQVSMMAMALEQGNIIEHGTHDKLIGQKGVYYSLYTGVFELE